MTTNSKYYYCNQWSEWTKSALELWDVTKAEKAHSKGEEYTVLVDDPQKPHTVILMAGLNNLIALSFLDDKLRVKKQIQFYEHGADKQFLAMITNREYDGETNKIIATKGYQFRKDGKLFIRKQTYNPHNMDVKEYDCSVDDHTFDRPVFGEYEHLLDINFSKFEQ